MWRGRQWSGCARAGLRGCIRPPLDCWTVQFPRRNTWPCTHHAPSLCTMVREAEYSKRSYTVTKNQFMYSFSGHCAASQSQFPHSCVSVSDLYILRIGPHISCSRIGKLIVGIYKSLRDTTWMWKLGLWPRKSFSGNICFEFPVLVLYSLAAIPN